MSASVQEHVSRSSCHILNVHHIGLERLKLTLDEPESTRRDVPLCCPGLLEGAAVND
jgi:hypothetical protein